MTEAGFYLEPTPHVGTGENREPTSRHHGGDGWFSDLATHSLRFAHPY